MMIHPRRMVGIPVRDLFETMHAQIVQRFLVDGAHAVDPREIVRAETRGGEGAAEIATVWSTDVADFSQPPTKQPTT